MINSNAGSICRIFFLLLLTFSLIQDIIYKNKMWIFLLLAIVFIIILDYFINQKVLMSKKNYYIFKHFSIKKYDYKDTRKIVILEEENPYGTLITLYFVLKNETIVKVNIGYVTFVKQIEKRLKNICKDKCIKFIFID